MNEKVSIQQLVNSLAEKHGLGKKEAETFVKEFFQLIEEGLEKEFYVKIKGLGTFKLIEVDNRESININTGERIEIQGHTKVSFTPDNALRDKVNKPFGHFETVVLEEGTVLEGMESEELPETDPEEPAGNVAETTVGKAREEEEKAKEAAPRSLADEIIARELAHSKSVRPLMAAAPQETFTELVKEKADEEESAPVNTAPERKSMKKQFIVIMAIVAMLCCAGVLYVFYPEIFEGKQPITQPAEPQEESSSAASSAEEPIALVADSASIVDSLRKANDLILEDVPDSEVVLIPETPSASTDYTSASDAYKIVGTKATHVVAAGESLGKISSQYFNARKFWPYILQHNQDILANPDMVRAGMKLKIPELVENSR